MKKQMVKNKGITNDCLCLGKAGISKKRLLSKGLPMNRYERRMLKRISRRHKFPCDY